MAASGSDGPAPGRARQRDVFPGGSCAYGLALAGEVGVRQVTLNVLPQLDLATGLAGCRTQADEDRAMLTEA